MPKIIVIGHLLLVIVENVVTCFFMGHSVESVMSVDGDELLCVECYSAK